MLQAELSVVAALMPPDDFDVALMRLAQSEALSHRSSFDGLFSASGLGQPLFCCSTGARSDAVAGLCFTLLLLTCSDSDGQAAVLVGQVLCPQSFAVFECPMILILTP